MHCKCVLTVSLYCTECIKIPWEAPGQEQHSNLKIFVFAKKKFNLQLLVPIQSLAHPANSLLLQQRDFPKFMKRLISSVFRGVLHSHISSLISNLRPLHIFGPQWCTPQHQGKIHTNHTERQSHKTAHMTDLFNTSTKGQAF